MSEVQVLTDGTKICLMNKGGVQLNGIDLIETNECKVTMSPVTKQKQVMNSPSQIERKVCYKCSIELEIAKVYTRFKKILLDNAKQLKETVYNFYGYMENDDGERESIRISKCWFNGDVDLFHVKSDADFANEKYTMGFMLENSNMDEVIDDGESWE